MTNYTIVIEDGIIEQNFFKNSSPQGWSMKQCYVLKKLSHYRRRKTIKSVTIDTVGDVEFVFARNDSFQKVNWQYGNALTKIITNESLIKNFDCFRSVIYIVTGQEVHLDADFDCTFESVEESKLEPNDVIAFGFYRSTQIMHYIKNNKYALETVLKSFRLKNLEQLECENIANCFLMHCAIYMGRDSQGTPIFLSKFGQTGLIGFCDASAVCKYLCMEKLEMFKIEKFSPEKSK